MERSHPTDGGWLGTRADLHDRLKRRAAELAKTPRGEGPPPTELGAVGFLAALTPGQDDEQVFECDRCGALCTYDGCDVHALWHQQLDASRADR